jgi:chromosome partitioning protein
MTGTPIIAVAQRKGGAGKTTTTANLAPIFHRTRRTVAIDLDQQESLGFWSGQSDRGTLHHIVRVLDETNDRVGETLRQIEDAAQGADLVLIDTMPGLDDASAAALLKADIILVPIVPAPLDLDAGMDMLDMIEQTFVYRQKPEPRVVVVPYRCKKRSQLTDRFPTAFPGRNVIIGPPIYDRTVNASAILYGLATIEHDPRSDAAGEWLALAKFVETLL